MSCDFRHIFNTRLSSKNITPRYKNKKLYMNDSPMSAAHRHAPAKTIKMMQGSSNDLTCFILLIPQTLVIFSKQFQAICDSSLVNSITFPVEYMRVVWTSNHFM